MGPSGYFLSTRGPTNDPIWAPVPPGVDPDLSGDFAALSGDYVNLSGDILDYDELSGDYVSTKLDYLETSGDYVIHSGLQRIHNQEHNLLTGLTGLDHPQYDFHKTGWPTTPLVTLSFTYATRTLAVSGGIWDYWISGVRYQKNGEETHQIDDTEGSWFIYYSGATLTGDQTPWVVTDNNKALVTYLYWDADNNTGIIVAPELHGYEMDAQTHDYNHNTHGARLSQGGALGNISGDENGNDDEDAQFSVELTVMYDEDLKYTQNARLKTADIPVYYRTGDDASNIWRVDESNSFPVVNVGGNRAGWNELIGSDWNVSEVNNFQFTLSHIAVTPDSDRPFVAFMGQNDFITLGQARSGAEIEINSLITRGLPMPELSFLGTIIFQTANIYNNVPQSRIRTTADGSDYIDLRSHVITRGGISVSVQDHNLLGNLQGGIADEYYHLKNQEYSDVQSLTGEWIVFSGDHVYVSGDYVSTKLDYLETSGDYAAGHDLSGLNDVDYELGEVIKSLEDSGVAWISGIGEGQRFWDGDSNYRWDNTIEAWVEIGASNFNFPTLSGLVDTDLPITPNDGIALVYSTESGAWTTGSSIDPNLSGDFSALSGDYVSTKLDYLDTSGDYVTLSGDYVNLSGDILDYDELSGDYVSTKLDYIDTSGDYVVLSGDYKTHKDTLTAHHDPSGYETVSGDYINLSGDYVDIKLDYLETSGDYAILSGDYVIASGDLSGVIGLADHLHDDLDDLTSDFNDLSGDFILGYDLSGLNDIDYELAEAIKSIEDSGGAWISGVAEGQHFWDGDSLYRWEKIAGSWIEIGASNFNFPLLSGLYDTDLPYNIDDGMALIYSTDSGAWTTGEGGVGMHDNEFHSVQYAVESGLHAQSHDNDDHSVQYATETGLHSQSHDNDDHSVQYAVESGLHSQSHGNEDHDDQYAVESGLHSQSHGNEDHDDQYVVESGLHSQSHGNEDHDDQYAVESGLHAEDHNNDHHTTNYEVASGNIQSHVGIPVTDAHHTQYTDGQVDTIVATHTSDDNAHHEVIEQSDVNTSITTHANDDDAHHAVFEPGDEDAAIATHASDANAHIDDITDITRANFSGLDDMGDDEAVLINSIDDRDTIWSSGTVQGQFWYDTESFYRWDDTIGAWIEVGASSYGAVALSGLVDTDLPDSIDDGMALVYSTDSGAWTTGEGGVGMHDNVYHSVQYAVESGLHSQSHDNDDHSVQYAVESGLHAEDHNNDHHTTNYETANANIQSHVATPVTDAHHVKTVKYTDGEVDTIVATHTSDDNAHHAVFEPGDEDAAIATHATDDNAHHEVIEQSDVNTSITTHTNDDDAHHAVFEPGDEDAAIATHTAIATAHQNAPGLIATHTAIATAHQNAPGLISTHASDDNAHHEVFEPGDEDAAISTHTSDDDAHHAIYLDADAVQAVEDAGVVLSASKGIHLNGNPPDDTYTGIILDIDTSGCNVGQPVYIDGSNSVAPAKADSISTMPCIGICVAAGKVLTHGVFRDDSGLILTAAGKVYVNDAVSAILTTPPSGVGDVVQIVGIAINTDEIFVSPSLDWVIIK